MTPDISNLKGRLRMNRFLLTVWPERLCDGLREEIRQLEIELMKTTTKATKPTAASTSPVPPPHPGWCLYVCVQRKIGGMFYPVGSEIPATVMATIPEKNLLAMIDNRECRWAPRRQNAPHAYAAPEPAPARPPNPAVSIISNPEGDAVAAWRATLDAMTALCGDDRTWARDLLLQDSRGSELYRRAVRVDASNRAVAENTYGRRVPAAL